MRSAKFCATFVRWCCFFSPGSLFLPYSEIDLSCYLQESPVLKDVNLMFNEIGPEGAEVLSRSLHVSAFGKHAHAMYRFFQLQKNEIFIGKNLII